MAHRISWKRILFALAIIGPGIITSAVDNDAGGIATYTVAGAHFGYGLLWTLIPITILLMMVQEMVARIGIVTGKGLADLIRENFGIKMTLVIMIGLGIANFFITMSEFAGISSAASLWGISPYFMVPFVALFVWILIVKLNYKKLEKFFLVLTLFYFLYIVSGFMAHPQWGQVFSEMVIPHIEFSPAYFYLVIAIIGTTITPWMQFYLQSSIVQKGIRITQLKYSRIDVIVGPIVTVMVSFFIMVSSAALLFSSNLRIESAVDAARALEPLGAHYASFLFAAGFFGAALFGAFIIPIATAYYVCEAFGWESGLNKHFKDAKHFYLLLSLMIFSAAGLILIPGLHLFQLMLFSQFINGLLLPVILLIILRLANNKKLMGEHRNTKVYNFFAYTGSALVIAATVVLLFTT